MIDPCMAKWMLVILTLLSDPHGKTDVCEARPVLCSLTIKDAYPTKGECLPFEDKKRGYYCMRNSSCARDPTE